MATKDTGGQRQTTKRTEEAEDAAPETGEEVRERQEKLSDDVEAILDEIDGPRGSRVTGGTKVNNRKEPRGR